ncbi:hypothetical protein RVR_6518 [Actinacidiphila reveromycinica]|uniref:KAP NTPase domain-containing protein n=1 Tax=Actinacidiphila reveromycinica TaxID=659352 RepID=A0A7U3UVX5_9ACTN|nr:P-loop NTPase fold protein [Streptomyces sp. SN-593]BBA99760.1 hypothetical protein RVR_6518 [Streptomyces sp. SN-593]
MAQHTSYGPPPAAPVAPRMGEGARGGLTLLNDEPVSVSGDDELGALWVAKQLSALLLAERLATPFTLAVDGGWGMGKSSLMRLLDAELGRSPRVHTVWYNAWSSTGADALEGLIKSVLAQLDPNILRRTLRRLRGGSGPARLLRALALLAAAPLGVAGTVDGLWRALSADATARNHMRDALSAMMADWTAVPHRGAPGRLLVIFIDDLDRCSQETVLALCEALKVYLDVPGLVFVVGCDHDAMGKQGMLRNLTPAGAAFMEKIFQTTYRIPALGNHDIQHYVRRCAGKAGIADLLDQDRLVALIGYRTDRNPRRIKRLVNGLLLEANLNPIWSGLSTEAVIRTLLVQQLYGPFYRLMTAQNEPGSQPEVVETFFSYCEVRMLLRSGAGWSSGDQRRLSAFLVRYSMALPAESDQNDRDAALHTLQNELPESFPELAADQGFVSLLRGLRMLQEAELVFQRLREGVDRPPVPPLPGPWGVSPSPYGQQEPYGWPGPYDRPEWYRPPEGRFGAPGMTPAPGSGGPVTLPPPAGDPGPAADRGVERSGAPAADTGERSGDGPRGHAPARSGAEQLADPGASTAQPGGPAGAPYAVPRTGAGGAPQQSGARPAGPADPVSPVLDPQGTETYPADYALPAGYGRRVPAPSRPQADGPGGPPPLVVVVGFTGRAAGSVGYALQRGGLRREFAFNGVLWTDWLARRPPAVLCHVAAFGERGHGFDLIRAAREDRDYQGVVVFYTPTLTPNERTAADGLDAHITDDPDEAAQLLRDALHRPPNTPSTGSG